MGLHHLADRLVGRPQDLERHKNRFWAAQLSQKAAAGGWREEVLIHARRRSEGFDKRWDFSFPKWTGECGTKGLSVTVRHGRRH
jgi:hypothetical protein